MPSDLKSFDRVAHCYDATRALPPGAEAAIVDGIAAAIRSVAPAPAILEVGIGTGRIAVPLTAAGVHVVGVDIAPAMLDRLRAKSRVIPVAFAEATQLPFRCCAFDAVLFVHVLHLVPDALAALRAAARVLRPGGVLLSGRTEYGDSPRRRLIVRARKLIGEITGADLGSGDWHTEVDRAFAAYVAESGACTAELVLARWMERGTGRQMLDALANRVYSSTWAIPETVMPELLRRLTPYAETLCDGLDRPIENEATVTLVSARLPFSNELEPH